jgi:hypothetical protein
VEPSVHTRTRRVVFPNAYGYDHALMPAAADRGETHSVRLLAHPDRWVFYLSDAPATRLVVFVHGFHGSAVGTWEEFAESGMLRSWWRDSDMLFVGYRSLKDTITGVSYRLRRELRNFFPTPPPQVLNAGGVDAGRDLGLPYSDLVLVGHSLGGLIVRRALCDEAQQWLEDLQSDPNLTPPPILSATTRLFSPASAGFRPAGVAGVAKASPFWPVFDMLLRRSPAYTDCLQDSKFLEDTRSRTEGLVSRGGANVNALRAWIAWANPDNVVLAERYNTDHVDVSVDNTSHMSVCKPRQGYDEPRTFVESGRV